MRVLLFSKTSAVGPSTRYRFLQYREGLEEAGIRLMVRPLFGETYFRLTRIRNPLARRLLKCLYVPLRFCHRLVQLLGVLIQEQLLLKELLIIQVNYQLML